jgi:geranylgeranyl reductase family protein
VTDVVVVGGGPAGSVTAAVLAARGHHVVVLEEHAAVGAPVHCTGLLGWEAFQEFDLPRDLILGEASAARFWGAAGQSVTAHGADARAAVVDRQALDALLADRARRAGAELHLGWRAERIEAMASGVVIEGRSPDQRLEARACVLACGSNYRFHRGLGLGLPGTFLQTAQVETPFPAMPAVEVQFGRRVAPAGFAWLVPLERAGTSHARIGLMCDAGAADRFDDFYQSLADRARVPVRARPQPRLKMLPLAPVRRTYADRVLAVGDAAGLVKPTTGGGIYYGMLSGTFAGAVLDEALRRDRLSARHLRRYELAWRRRLGREIRLGLAFRRIAARLDDASIDALIELARVNGILPLLQQHASFNWHGKAALALLSDPGFRRIVFASRRAH